MANAAGMIYESIWRDHDWQELNRRPQALYMQLLSQKELDCAGVLPLQPEKWATGCNELTVAEVWEDLDALQNARFVFYDRTTYEALVRTHIRNSNVLKVPNMRKSALRAAALLASPTLRVILAQEMVATGIPELVNKAAEINPSLRVTEPFANPSVTLKSEPLPNPSVTLTEPTGVGYRNGNSHLGNYSRGEQPRPNCSKHPDGNPDDEPCYGCQKTREWDNRQAAQREADELRAKRLARERADNCPICQGTNWIPDTDPAVKCNHEYETQGATSA